MSILSTRILLILIVIAAAYSFAFSQTTPERQRNYPVPVEGDYTIKDFKFRSGESLPELKLHYMTLGTPAKDNSGVVRNAVLIMHGTGGTGAQFLSPQFANVLFGPGQLLDATKYFIILPDGIGHGRSSKPSDGLHLKFPHYTYDDMVLAQYRLITEKLGVNHLRLVMGTSMGGMHTWVWGETYPDFMDALMPLASMPIEIAGRNRIMRKMIMDAIRNDPSWNNGEYKTQPVQGLTAAENILLLMGSAPLQWHKQAPTRDAADKFYEERVKSGVMRTDANDMLYYFDASREYNPSPTLEKIKAPLIAVNSADDTINPPELGVMEQEIKRVKNGRYVLLPITDQTRGHGTHTIASIWQGYLKELLENSNQQSDAALLAHHSGDPKLDRAVEKANSEFIDAMKTGDAATIAAPYTEDASFITIDGACVQGRTEIEKMYRDRFARSGLAQSTKINSKKLVVDNDLAYESGYGEIGLLKDGKLLVGGGRFLTVWQRQTNGDWKILRNIVLR